MTEKHLESVLFISSLLIQEIWDKEASILSPNPSLLNSHATLFLNLSSFLMPICPSVFHVPHPIGLLPSNHCRQLHNLMVTLKPNSMDDLHFTSSFLSLADWPYLHPLLIHYLYFPCVAFLLYFFFLLNSFSSTNFTFCNSDFTKSL